MQRNALNTSLVLGSVHAVQSMTSLVFLVCSTKHYWYCALWQQYRALYSLLQYSTLLLLCFLAAVLSMTSLVSHVCSTIHCWPCTQCLQDNTMLALYSVYAIQLVTSLILSVCSTMHDWPHTESMQMHRGKEDSKFVTCLGGEQLLLHERSRKSESYMLRQNRNLELKQRPGLQNRCDQQQSKGEEQMESGGTVHLGIFV